MCQRFQLFGEKQAYDYCVPNENSQMVNTFISINFKSGQSKSNVVVIVCKMKIYDHDIIEYKIILNVLTWVVAKFAADTWLVLVWWTGLTGLAAAAPSLVPLLMRCRWSRGSASRLLSYIWCICDNSSCENTCRMAGSRSCVTTESDWKQIEDYIFI